jgi:hypothetical protein
MKLPVITNETLLGWCSTYLIAPKLLAVLDPALIPVLTPVVVIVDIRSNHCLTVCNCFMLEISSLFTHYFTATPLVTILHSLTLLK